MIKIFILPTSGFLRPDTQPFIYPNHNQDYGVEQDFYSYLKKNRFLLADSPKTADWHYLPVFWTRYYLNNNYGSNGIDEAQKEVNRVIIDDKKTFTIVQYDDGPLVDLGNATLFLSSRKSSRGIDIPLLCSPHKVPFFLPRKRYTASFSGRVSTHAIREDMFRNLSENKEVFLHDGHFKSSEFTKIILQSYFSLCPRGYGGSSFRLFESLQLGVAPICIGDIDTRPFKGHIRWEDFSFYISDTKDLHNILNHYSKLSARTMGSIGRSIYKNQVTFFKWCDLLIKELNICKA